MLPRRDELTASCDCTVTLKESTGRELNSEPYRHAGIDEALGVAHREIAACRDRCDGQDSE
jgi:hypothetical protein